MLPLYLTLPLLTLPGDEARDAEAQALFTIWC